MPEKITTISDELSGSDLKHGMWLEERMFAMYTMDLNGANNTKFLANANRNKQQHILILSNVSSIYIPG